MVGEGLFGGDHNKKDIAEKLDEISESQEHILKRLDKIFNILEQIINKEKHMSVELDALTAQVAANTDIEKSAVALIQGIAAQLIAIKDDPAKIQALADSLKASDDDLAAAITANTPAA